MTEYFKYTCPTCNYSYVAVAFAKYEVRERQCEVCELDGRGKQYMKGEQLEERPW